MSQLLSQLSDSIALLVATAAPALTAIRVGANQHVTGFLWQSDLIVTDDQTLPAAASYTVVLSTGALISAQPGPRDPGRNLASLRLDVPVPAALPNPARSATIGALILALGANFDGSPTVRLTTIHGFPRGAGSAGAITLDLAGGRVSRGGIVLDADGRLLGMTSASPGGDAVVVPHSLIARFAEAATSVVDAGVMDAGVVNAGVVGAGLVDAGVVNAGVAAAVSRSMTLPAVLPGPQVAAAAAQFHGGLAGAAGNGLAPGGSQASLQQRRGWLGVSLQPITVPDNLAHRAGQRTARQVVGITRGGPADRAGLRSGDVLLALDGASTTGNHTLRAFLAPERIGSEVEVRLMRDGLIHTTILTIAAQPEA